MAAPSVPVATRLVLDASVAERDLGRTAAAASQGVSWHGVDLFGCETRHRELIESKTFNGRTW